ncbi:hypothetical protein FJM67_12615 [Maribrevibacterium harenarium]|uniref:Uncharacterized protein n=1 Tax=Maribrevibacterium harenarium TaxID=2589817 RepID=A0A501WHM4_9GAMM|nr:hypothetical protein [Maribrevibacterium harenarium]TPE49029.1 hypothetical protein FJM67_12615 [Maribrevibacterium harenarium]
MGIKHSPLFLALATVQIVPKEPHDKATATIHSSLDEKCSVVCIQSGSTLPKGSTFQSPLAREVLGIG